MYFETLGTRKGFLQQPQALSNNDRPFFCSFFFFFFFFLVTLSERSKGRQVHVLCHSSLRGEMVGVLGLIPHDREVNKMFFAPVLLPDNIFFNAPAVP